MKNKISTKQISAAAKLSKEMAIGHQVLIWADGMVSVSGSLKNAEVLHENGSTEYPLISIDGPSTCAEIREMLREVITKGSF